MPVSEVGGKEEKLAFYPGLSNLNELWSQVGLQAQRGSLNWLYVWGVLVTSGLEGSTNTAHSGQTATALFGEQTRTSF